MANLVLSVIGEDRPGLVSALSDVVAAHGGSWDQSRMAHLGGKFAGIVLVGLPDDEVTALRTALAGLSDQGLLEVAMTPAGEPVAVVAGRRRLVLDLVGADRPGIVREVSTALASHGVGIEELHTATREAPMAGGLLFEVQAVLAVPGTIAEEDLRRALEQIAQEFVVDLAPDDARS